MSDFFYRALFYFCVCGVPRRRRSARTPCRKKQSSDCAGSRRLSTIAKRIARVGRDARDEGISWRSKARVFCSIRAVVRIKRRGKRDEFWMFVCRPMRFVRFLCVYASLQKREKKKRESKASCVARATRERRIERAKSFETYRTHRFHRGLGRFARILPLSRAGLRV